MARTESAGDVGVILGFLVGILDQQANGSARSLAFEHPRENLHLIRFTPLGGIAAGARLTAVQFNLQVRFTDFQARGAAVHDSAQGGAMTFTESGNAKTLTETVTGHAAPLEKLIKSIYYQKNPSNHLRLAKALAASLTQSARRSSRYSSSCARVSMNTPCPPRSNSNQKNGTWGQVCNMASQLLPTSTISTPSSVS